MDSSRALALRSLLHGQQVASLATLHKGEPAVSMVPYALLPKGQGFVIHVSQLATHTADMLADPAVALLLVAAPGSAPSPLEIPRASVKGRAHPCAPDAPEYPEAREAYLSRFPESEEMFSFADFSLYIVTVSSVRFVGGIANATSILAPEFASVMGGEPAMETNRESFHSRLIDAPPEAVFASFADPSALAQWWGPAGFTSTFETFEFRNGGTWRLVMHGPDGADYNNESVFREIVPNERIVIDHLRDFHHFVLTVTLAAEGQHATRVGWRQVFDTAEELERMAPVIGPANEQNLDRLEATAVGRARLRPNR
jgi:uncharacterized protein YndB with AHSA1/START domain